MASSSSRQMRTNKHHNPLEEQPSGELEIVKEGRDWLQLGLEFGFSTTTTTTECNKKPASVSSTAALLAGSASPPSPDFFNHHLHHGQPHHQQLQMGFGLGLGLGLKTVGFDYKGERCVLKNGDQENGHHQDHHSYDDDYGDKPLWPRHQTIDKSSNNNFHRDRHCRQIPVFSISNDYSRPRPGFWFTLLSSTNRFGDKLPQVPKAYIRVRDENMTIFMVKKYLVTKLGLSNEAEVDISCMGMNLLQTLTLKQVRDTVWLPRLMHSVNSAKMTTTFLFKNSQDMSMPLHYTRRFLNLNM